MTENVRGVFSTMGASNHSADDRASHDYYATDPKAVDWLLSVEELAPVIWEPACGEGHISKRLEEYGKKVISTDIVYRGYGCPEGIDFLQTDIKDFEGDIVTNPPYRQGLEFVEKALDIVHGGGTVAMFLRLLFLEGKKRKEFFMENPPRRVYVFSSRIACAKNGNFDENKNAVCFAWFVWTKGYKGDTVVKWIG